jgi:hypothetical protein
VAASAFARPDANESSCERFPGTEASPGFRVQLPDCRAYELVSPPGKFGQPSLVPLLNDPVPFLDESHLKMASVGGFSEAGADEGTVGSGYLSSRVGSGWQTAPLDFPTSQFGGAVGIGRGGQVQDTSADFTKTVIMNRPPGGKPVDLRFYIREPLGPGGSCPSGATLVGDPAPNGCASEIGPAVPPGVVQSWNPSPTGHEFPEIFYRGASTDLSNIVFSSVRIRALVAQWLWPGDATSERQSLYEYVGRGNTVPRLVGLDNAGHQIGTCGTTLGGNERSSQVSSRRTFNAISASGSTVFFTDWCSGDLFARIGDPQAATTVNVAGTLGCGTVPTCNVTSEPVFQGASRDGRRVFFTTEQPLSPSDHDTTNDIYECELPGDAAPHPPAEGVVNACPSLRPVTVTGTSTGASVTNVLAISPDGSHIYFTAQGILTSTPNEFGLTAKASAANLYVYERDAVFPSGHITFVGVSPNPAAATTPDGRFLLFTTATPLTPDVSGGVEELYQFDALHETLAHVSAAEGPLGKEEHFGFEIPASLSFLGTSENVSQAGTEGVAMSDDGSYVFFQSPNGLTEGALNRQCAIEKNGECELFASNVYEYHAGHVYLISDGQDRHVTLGAPMSELIGATHAGHDVFFVTADALVPQDGDSQVDIYDARIGGGLPPDTSPPACSGEECQGAPSAPPSFASPSSATVVGSGNLAPPPPQTPSRPALDKSKQLAKALAVCRMKHSRRARASCESRARRRYGAAHAGRKARHARHRRRGRVG